ncbi:MAG: GGDEF domain-containing protein, partial [Solirubrobacterales bacterium]|nr:GGDEF domain-containing protein [Solirubrobacterales bacterium]MBV9473823.1 GGDEF domain-containing protein [Solirubrobacterales bacterium]
RATEEALEQTLSAARRHGRQLSMLLIDIDHFKRVNDEFGHRCGDEVLRHVADVLESTLRTEDVAGRWGGEEFVVILPSTDGEGAIRVAERLRVLIADTPAQVPNDRSHPVTVTIGAAEWGSESMEELVARADEALYAGKSAGRNTVALAQPAVAGEPQLV